MVARLKLKEIYPLGFESEVKVLLLVDFVCFVPAHTDQGRATTQTRICNTIKLRETPKALSTKSRPKGARWPG